MSIRITDEAMASDMTPHSARAEGDGWAVTLWVPKTSSMSCEQAIFVDQASGASVFSDAVLLKIDRLG